MLMMSVMINETCPRFLTTFEGSSFVSKPQLLPCSPYAQSPPSLFTLASNPVLLLESIS